MATQGICPCGKRFAATMQPGVRRIQCPACGRILTISDNRPTRTASERHERTASLGFLIGNWIAGLAASVGKRPLRIVPTWVGITFVSLWAFSDHCGQNIWQVYWEIGTGYTSSPKSCFTRLDNTVGRYPVLCVMVWLIVVCLLCHRAFLGPRVFSLLLIIGGVYTACSAMLAASSYVSGQGRYSIQIGIADAALIFLGIDLLAIGLLYLMAQVSPLAPNGLSSGLRKE